MLDHPALYLIIDLLVLSVPLLRAFEGRIAYYKSFKVMILAMVLTMAVFIPWDAWFTAKGWWGFEPEYLVGWSLFGLPLEEWLFFVVVPFSSLFIYRVLNYFFPKAPSQKFAANVQRFLVSFSVAMAILHSDKMYPLLTFSLLAIALLLAPTVLGWERLGFFFRAYGLVLVPFLATNGILTGGLTTKPIVWYNDAQNMGFRIWTIPFEDAFYGMLLLLMNLMWIVWLQKKNPAFGTGF